MDFLTTMLTRFLVFTLLFYNCSAGNILAYILRMLIYNQEEI
jgi:hypothetical protein